MCIFHVVEGATIDRIWGQGPGVGQSWVCLTPRSLWAWTGQSPASAFVKVEGEVICPLRLVVRI